MNGNFNISSREAYPVSLGGAVIYCEHFKMTSLRAFAEKSAVSGTPFFSNSCRKALRITIEGRVYEKNLPLHLAEQLNTILAGNMSLDIEYRGLCFNDCHIQFFSAEEKGEDFAYYTINLLTNDYISRGDSQV